MHLIMTAPAIMYILRLSNCYCCAHAELYVGAPSTACLYIRQISIHALRVVCKTSCLRKFAFLLVEKKELSFLIEIWVRIFRKEKVEQEKTERTLDSTNPGQLRSISSRRDDPKVPEFMFRKIRARAQPTYRSKINMDTGITWKAFYCSKS